MMNPLITTSVLMLVVIMSPMFPMVISPLPVVLLLVVGIICPNIEEEEVESPLPIPLQNVIDLDLEAIVVHVLVLHPIIHPSTLPPSKPKTTTKEYPPLTLIGYSWVYGKVVSYANSLCSYESIIEFLEGVKFCHVDCSDAMIIKSCLANVCILFELDNPFIFEF